MANFLMWFFIFLFVFTWILYPLSLYLLNLFRRRGIKNVYPQHNLFSISFIIAAHNEGKCIEKRISNLLSLDYKQGQAEVIVVSDGSTDETGDIVQRISEKNTGVILIAFRNQQGRACAHNEAIKKAKGDIAIFTDAKTYFEKDFLTHIMPHFSEEKVGCVSGRMYYRNKNDSSIANSADFYWRYEEPLRILESNLGILAFGSGAALAVRRVLYQPIGLDEDIDRVVPLDMRISGYRVEYEPRAVAYDVIEADEKSNLEARIRKTARAFKDILRRLAKISPVKDTGLFYAVFMHKTSRHLVPFYMLIIFSVNLMLLGSGALYLAIFYFQCLFFTLAFIGWFLEKMRIKFIIFSFPYNFLLMNIGRLLGVLKSVFGGRVVIY